MLILHLLRCRVYIRWVLNLVVFMDLHEGRRATLAHVLRRILVAHIIRRWNGLGRGATVAILRDVDEIVGILTLD